MGPEYFLAPSIPSGTGGGHAVVGVWGHKEQVTCLVGSIWNSEPWITVGWAQGETNAEAIVTQGAGCLEIRV